MEYTKDSGLVRDIKFFINNGDDGTNIARVLNQLVKNENHSYYNGNEQQIGSYKDCQLCQSMVKWLRTIPKDLILEVA